MPSRTANARKRKETTTIPEVLVSSDDHSKSQSKARRVSTDASASATASLQVDTPPVVIQSTATKDEEAIKSIGKMIQDLFCSDSAKVDAALDALHWNFMSDKNKCERFVTAGGCLALVQLLTKCLNTAIAKIPACDQITELNELTELTTLDKTLDAITNLTLQHNESKVGIAMIGGVEAVVKVMKTFPKCQALQERACYSLANFACCSIGVENAIESGGIELLLAAVNNHLVSADVCEYACWALHNIVDGSKENIRLLISLGGGATVAKIKTKWPNNDLVQTEVRDLADCFAAEWKTWANEDEA
jgi:hypothetical protein